MSLQNLIIKQDAHALDEMSKQSLKRHLQKLTKAAQISFAKGALQQDQIQFLTTISNEAKVRRSTKSLVLGKAKVMSYEDLEEARAKRAKKETANEAKGKGKRGQKCKSATPKVDEATADKVKCGRKRKRVMPEADTPEPARASGVQMSGTQIMEDKSAPEPFRAPVARMW